MKGTDKPTCGDYGGHRKDGEPCTYVAGWGTEFEDGKCKKHRGTSPDGKSHENNDHAVTHGLYAEENNFYTKVMTEEQQTLCDQIFQDYCTQFRERNGEPHTGEQSRLFEIAVNHIKIIYSDNWAMNKPGELRSGNPMVDKGQRYNSEGVPYEEYKETVVLKGQQKLRNSDRQWLKDYGLLNDPDSAQANATRSLADVLSKES